MKRISAAVASVAPYCGSTLTNLLLAVWLPVATMAFGVGPFFLPHSRCSTSRLHQAQRPSAEEAARAGESGFSILRQPVQWDPNEVPSFDAPTSLDQQKGAMLQDVEWLNQRRKGPSPKISKPSKSPMDKEEAVEAEEELDLFQRTLDTLDYPILLKNLKRHCRTHPARQLVNQAGQVVQQQQPTNKGKQSKKSKQNLAYNERAFQPLTATDDEGLRNRYASVEEMSILMDSQSDELLTGAYYRNTKGRQQDLGPPPFGGMTFDLESILDIADQGNVLEGPEILEIVTMLDTMQEAQLWNKGLSKVETYDFIELPKMVDCISVNETLQELLHTAFDKQGRLSGRTFPLVGQLRSRVQALKAEILDTLNDFISSPSISSKLALESGGSTFSEVNGRIVIPIEEGSQSNDIGIVHDASRSGKTVYVEPTLVVGPTNELRQTEAELRMEEARVWRSLTEQILQNRFDLETSVAAMGQLDLIMARVTLGNILNGVIPEVGSEGIISLRDAKHPVLILREIDNVVGSDIDIGADGNQGMVLTGPNSGGKTVILKLLGLVALMARNGIPIPAAPKSSDGYTPRVDFFDPVLADIGDLQSVGGDLSTFSGHMLVCREVLASATAGENALVLMDELGSGTDPSQGVAIAQALLEALVDTGARCAITTHYMELKQLAASDDRFAVGGMQFVNGRPTYKLLPGTVGESFALAVAERFQLPSTVIERANELLDQETRQMGDLLRDLEDQKGLVDRQSQELEKKKEEMERLEQDMKRQQEVLEAKQLSARRDEAKKFATKLEEKEKVLEDILEKLKRDPSRRIVAKSWDDIKYTKRDALDEAELVPSVVMAKADKKKAIAESYADLVPIAEMRDKPDIEEGDTLQICQEGPFFGREATVLRAGKRLEVKVGSMLLQMKLKDVALPNSKVRPRQAQPTGPGNRNAKAVERALANEDQSSVPQQKQQAVNVAPKSNSNVSIRTDANTVDVRGCNLMEASSKIRDKISMSLQANRKIIYVLHGYGESGVLRTKVRDWLKTERQLVKRWTPADASDGGNAFTKVEIRGGR